MPNSSSRPHDAEELVEDLLAVVRQLSKDEPSSSIRARLEALASQRLQEGRGKMPRAGGRKRLRSLWLGPIFATAISALFMAGPLIVGRLRQPLTDQSATPPTSRREHSLGQEKTVVVRNSGGPKTPTSPHRRVVEPAVHVAPEKLIVDLPYSNSDIANGTSVTIRVAMSRSELMGLGFPVSEAVQDRRVVAELSLGDDGLPRAISLPLPLEFVKEQK